MFESFFSKFVPKVKAEEAKDEAPEEEELVDPQETLRGKCREGKHALALAEKLQTCNDRVNSRTKTTETCVEELIDLWDEVEHCVSHKLFSQLK